MDPNTEKTEMVQLLNKNSTVTMIKWSNKKLQRKK